MSEIVLPHMLDAGIDPRADIFNRLLRNRVIMLGAAVDDDIANQVCAQLQKEGVAAFAKSFDTLMAAIAKKAAASR